ncbi:MAG: hypothetical protein ACWA5P_07585 [bacterium]
MSKHYTEKALQATNNKIDRIVEDNNFFERNINLMIVLAVLFSFVAPYLGKEKTIMEELEISYSEAVVFWAMVSATFCYLCYFMWKVQDKMRLKKLIKRKKELEKDLESYQ